MHVLGKAYYYQGPDDISWGVCISLCPLEFG